MKSGCYAVNRIPAEVTGNGLRSLRVASAIDVLCCPQKLAQ